MLAREYHWSISEIRSLAVRERRWLCKVIARRIDKFHAVMEENMH